jgi:hypothetical protein
MAFVFNPQPDGEVKRSRGVQSGIEIPNPILKEYLRL